MRNSNTTAYVYKIYTYLKLARSEEDNKETNFA
jgi:hypothetical protein